MIKVYIASPYTIGDPAVNVRFQIEIGNNLINMGYAPFIPLLSHFQHLIFPRHYEDWLKLDMEWISICDCLLRLGGESKGADREVTRAHELGKQVFYSVEEMDNYYNSEYIPIGMTVDNLTQHKNINLM